MTDWGIVAVVAVGASIFLGVVGVAWDFKFNAECGCTIHEPMIGKHWFDPTCNTHTEVFDTTQTGTVNVDAFLLDAEEFLTQLDDATHRRGRHLAD